MFTAQEALVEPGQDHSVWRYMDLARFVSLLERSALFFTQAARMVDSWEGSLGSFGLPMSDETRRHAIEVNRKTTYLSCWHASEYESAATWDIYQREGRAIAIRTTWGNLTSAVTSPWPITGGSVTYVDPHVSTSSANVFHAPFGLKRKSFEHEREARLILWGNGKGGPDERRGRVPGIEEDIFYSDESTGRPGYHVQVDLVRLIKWVYVSPDSPKWIEETIAGLVGRFGYEFPIVKSDLYSDPFLI